jgi:hypothetical protein
MYSVVLGLCFCELREVAVAAAAFAFILCQLNSFYLVCNMCGTYGCLYWQLMVVVMDKFRGFENF